MAEKMVFVAEGDEEWPGEFPLMQGMYVGDCSVIIPDTKRYSNTFDFAYFKSLALYIPVGFAGTTITFYASATDTEDELVMGECYDGAAVPAAITLTVAADRYVCPDPALLKGLRNIRFLKLRAGIIQTADMDIRIFALA